MNCHVRRSAIQVSPHEDERVWLQRGGWTDQGEACPLCDGDRFKYRQVKWRSCQEAPAAPTIQRDHNGGGGWRWKSNLTLLRVLFLQKIKVA